MRPKDRGLKLTARELAIAFATGNWAEKFPPVLSTEQAAELIQVPKATLYDWRSRGLLEGCCRKIGKHLRFIRDRLLEKLFDEGTDPNDK